MRKVLRLLVPVLIIAIGLGALYYFWSKRVADKAADLPPAAEGPGAAASEADEKQKARLEQTLKTMEETRRLNEQARPGAANPPNPNPAADLQRTFKTIEEINRLNRLNREMREKQQSAPNRP